MRFQLEAMINLAPFLEICICLEYNRSDPAALSALAELMNHDVSAFGQVISLSPILLSVHLHDDVYLSNFAEETRETISFGLRAWCQMKRAICS